MPAAADGARSTRFYPHPCCNRSTGKSELAGKRLELPKADKALQRLRNLAIAEARRTHTAPEAAHMFDLTRRRIIMIHKEISLDADQDDLFS